MLKIRYSLHATERLRERRISRDEVVNAIYHGDIEDARDGLKKTTYRNERRILIVIYDVLGADEVEIITAYWK